MAICSSDHKISIYHKNDENTWVMDAKWDAHSAPVLKLSWCPIQQGLILASCGLDKVAIIWEQSLAEQKWNKKYVTADSKSIVNDLEFCPTGDCAILVYKLIYNNI